MDEIKILVIEDDADIREGIRILLESEGFHVDEAENGEAGLQKLSEDVSLVILDIMMPGMSGFRVCNEIRKKSYVPILFLSAKAQESDKLPAYSVCNPEEKVIPLTYLSVRGGLYDELSDMCGYLEKQGYGTNIARAKCVLPLKTHVTAKAAAGKVTASE